LWQRCGVPELDAITRSLNAAGLDIVHAFDAHAVAREPGWEQLARGGRLGILVGNTRVLWPKLAAARAADREFAESSDPIERYTERHVGATAGVAVYAHRQYGGAYLPFQRLAVAAGLAALAPSQLLVHPVYGPWFALRALITVDSAEAPAPVRVARACACEAGCEAAFERAMARPAEWRLWLAMRDACPIGREYRYSDDQIAYHYTKDRRFLP
jgi:methylmalonic aciduria homocystinuria type C protein